MAAPTALPPCEYMRIDTNGDGPLDGAVKTSRRPLPSTPGFPRRPSGLCFPGSQASAANSFACFLDTFFMDFSLPGMVLRAEMIGCRFLALLASIRVNRQQDHDSGGIPAVCQSSSPSSMHSSTPTARGSSENSFAVSKLTPCFARLLVFFRSPHSKSIVVRTNSYLPYHTYYGFRTRPETRRGIYVAGAEDTEKKKKSSGCRVLRIRFRESQGGSGGAWKFVC